MKLQGNLSALVAHFHACNLVKSSKLLEFPRHLLEYDKMENLVTAKQGFENVSRPSMFEEC